MEENEDEYDYENAFTRLLASVYQPFVDLSPGVLMEAERLLFFRYNGRMADFIENFLTPTTDLLCRLQRLAKKKTTSTSSGSPIGWPLCTYNRIIIHLGQPVVAVDAGQQHLETGDFYVSVLPRPASGQWSANKEKEKIGDRRRSFDEINTSAVGLTLFFYDGSKFCQLGDEPLTYFLNLFAHCSSGATDTCWTEFVDANSISIFLNEQNRSIKLRRYMATKSSGDLDFLTMPLTFISRNNTDTVDNSVPANNRSYAQDTVSTTTSSSSSVQNEAYFSFQKNYGNQTIVEEEDEQSTVNNKKISEDSNNDVIYCDKSTTPIVDSDKNGQRRRSSTSLLLFLSKENVAYSLPQMKQIVDIGDSCTVTSVDTSVASTVQNFAGRCPRKIVDLTRVHLLLAGFVRYTGTVLWEECQTCLVEISLYLPLDKSIESSDFARTLVYLNYVHRSSSNITVEEICNKTQTSSLLLLIDCRQELSREITNQFIESLDILKTLRSNISCRFVLVEASDYVKGMFQENLPVSEIENYSIEELCSKLPVSDLSVGMGGERKYDGTTWIRFRKDLESFMDMCRMAAKFYIDAIQRLKKFNENNSPSILWSFSVEELDGRLKNDLQYTIEASVALESFFVTGQAELEKLNEFVKTNDSLPHYREAVSKVSAFFDEVSRVMVKFQQGSDRFSSMLEEISRAKRVLNEADTTIVWLNKEVLPGLNKFRCKANGMKNVKSLHTEFLTYKNSGLVESNLQRISNVQSSLVGLTELRHVTPVLLSPGDIQCKEMLLNDLLNEYNKQLEICSNNLSSSLLCYQLLDEAYEWALDSTKLATNLGRVLSNYRETVDEKETLLNMREKLMDYSNRNPRYDKQKLEKMRSIARQLNDERLAIQCQAADIRCNDTGKLLTNLKQRVEEVLHVNVDDDPPQSCDQPGSAVQQKSMINLNNAEECVVEKSIKSRASSISSVQSATSSSQSMANRFFGNFNKNYRRSFAGSCSTSSLHNVTSDNRRNSEYRYSVKSQKSCSSGLVFVDKDDGDSSALHPSGVDVITEDFTDQVASSISTTMLRKKIAERRANSNHQSLSDKKKYSQIYADPPPTVTSSGGVDKLRRPFRKFIRRTNVVVVESTRQNSLLDEEYAKSRHPSLDSLSSVGDESYHSSSLSAKSLPVSPLDDAVSGAGTSTNEDAAPPYPAPFLPPEADEKLRVSTPPPGCSPTLRMQYNVVNELLQTEVAYVRSLQYVIDNYIPEMQRTDLPHVLRGQRRVIFGNIEKIQEFHVGHFLPDLTRFCMTWTESLGLFVAKCFLRHRQKFHLYALYNKNKPNSDALISECAGVFFRTKQLLLGDKLDLWSYLLKPVQRISKYSLFIQKLLKACPPEDLEQIETLKSVEEMLSSQLQHGNDLLAMDSIKNCDLNLKEHGKLLRQEEFVVFEGRHSRKCVRRIFLFESLVLFAKPRKSRSSGNGNGGGSGSSIVGEIYHYKNSIKMSDLGLTETVNDSELKFELWFRRHTSDEKYVILAPNMAMKMAWVTKVSTLLWQQAYTNRDLRNNEMTSMGVGSKMCVDLNSEDRIQDRAVDDRLLFKVDRSRNALPSNLDVDRYNLTTKRPHSLISLGSSSSSSNNSSMCSSGLHSLSATTPMSFESGIFVDLSTLEEYPDDPTTTTPLSEENVQDEKVLETPVHITS